MGEGALTVAGRGGKERTGSAAAARARSALPPRAHSSSNSSLSTGPTCTLSLSFLLAGKRDAAFRSAHAPPGPDHHPRYRFFLCFPAPAQAAAGPFLAPFPLSADPAGRPSRPLAGQFIIDQFEHRNVQTGEVVEDHHPEQVRRKDWGTGGRAETGRSVDRD